MLGIKLYMAQRLSALFMIPFTFLHLGLMVYAIQGGLSAGEILSRTQGSLLWFLFYGGFVLSVSVHASIGLRVIIHEIFGTKEMILNILTIAVGLGLLLLGFRAVLAVTS